MKTAFIAVLAGTNGAGKSSVGGAMLEGMGVDYFNPDLVAREILQTYEGLAIEEANALAWRLELSQLQQAIAEGKNFAFETTLGGNTITSELLRAASAGIAIRVWYVGLSSVDIHIERVAARVAKGGHNIPEGKIRERYNNSRLNLLKLMPSLAELKVFDNSDEADPTSGHAAEPQLLLHMEGGKIVAPDVHSLTRTPDWAKPLVEFALKMQEKQS